MISEDRGGSACLVNGTSCSNEQARPHIQERVEGETVFPGCRTPIPVWEVPLVTARFHKNGNPSARLGPCAWRSSIFLLLRPPTNFA